MLTLKNVDQLRGPQEIPPRIAYEVWAQYGGAEVTPLRLRLLSDPDALAYLVGREGDFIDPGVMIGQARYHEGNKASMMPYGGSNPATATLVEQESGFSPGRPITPTWRVLASLVWAAEGAPVLQPDGVQMVQTNQTGINTQPAVLRRMGLKRGGAIVAAYRQPDVRAWPYGLIQTLATVNGAPVYALLHHDERGRPLEGVHRSAPPTKKRRRNWL